MPKYRVRREPKERLAIPLPEALPGRGDASWTITKAKPGSASCRYTEGKGELRVPLTNEPCEKCGKNHAAAARLHELTHAAISPDAANIRTSFKSKGETFDVNLESITLAEEMRVDYKAAQVARNRKIDFEHTCKNDIDYLMEYVDTNDLRDLAVEALARSDGLAQLDRVFVRATEKVVEYREKGDQVSAKKWLKKREQITAIRDAATNIKQFARKNYEANFDSWTRQLHIGYTIQEYLQHFAEQEAALQQTLKNIEQAGKTAEKGGPPEPKKDADTEAVEQMLNQYKGYREQTLVEKLTSQNSFAKALEETGKLIAKRDDSGKDGKVKWGEMKITKAKLTKKLPVHKAGWKSRASAEGSIPLYMHRWPIDQAIFKNRRKEPGGTVLIDVSGSMSLSAQELMEIVEAAPAATIAMYSGAGWVGELRIIAEKGKMLDIPRTVRDTGSFKPGMHGGNQIDKPALEWLANQAYPRIWVSDGQVVSPTHGWSSESWGDCKKVLFAGRITRVDNAEQAAEALDGRRVLQR